MTDQQTLTFVLPLLLISLVIFRFIVVIFFRSHIQLIRKTFFRYVIISLIICLSFSLIYFVVGMYEVFLALQKDKNNFQEELTNITGLIFNTNENSKLSFYSVFTQFLFFSFSVYFHIPTTIDFIGFTQIATTIEGALGIMIPLLVVLITFIELSKNGNEKKTLQIFLSRGWNILRTRSSASGVHSLEIISPEKEIQWIFVDNIEDFKDELEFFTINWNNEDIDSDLLPYYLRVLEEDLRKCDTSLSVQSQILFSKKNNTTEFLQQYKEFLETLMENTIFIMEARNFEQVNLVLKKVKYCISIKEIEDSTNA
ncbi:hypothetical protein [Paenibacillus amylolyticus]|uniref:hypothetical protein n=1 Tax=Paenibacillus amylolyticus TaxID=1451 RepID=UPI00096D354F|nr:hypothetical protein [Paenibacillus amylolyticus]OMF45412.1 hypothetical protein BK136_09935 [Paenibacillus amylolyticus]